METTSPPANEQDRTRNRWMWLLLLLALLMSFGCVFCSTQLALSFWPDRLTPASMLSERQADYGGGPNNIRFRALDPSVGDQAATDTAFLHITPVSKVITIVPVIGLLPATPTVTPIPTPTPRPSPAPATAASTATRIPLSQTPTRPTLPTATYIPTVVPPSPTWPPTLAPTNTPLPSPLPPSPTPIPSPTYTPLPPAPPPPNPPVNNAPNTADDAVTTNEDTPIVVPVLANDSDSDGALVFNTLAVISGAVEGLTVVDTVSGQITYTPNLNYNGVDSFVYQICDDDGACNTATVGVTIDPVNDPPVALDDIAFTAEDTPENITVLDNDTDVDGNPLTVVAVGNAANGSTTTNGTVVTYDPNLNYVGTNTFTYTISDGSLQDTAMVTITVNGINDPPVAIADAFSTTMNITLTVLAPGVLTNDTDVDIGDTLTAVWVSNPVSGTLILDADGSFVYVPDTGFIGVDTFIYRARDALMALSEPVTVTISVS